MLRAKVSLVEGGCITLGLEKAGFNVDEVMLISDDALEANTRHLAFNRPDLKYTKPTEWETEDYLRGGMSKQDLDSIFFVPACSGLSSINRNASADAAQNIHFYRSFDAAEKILPKTFMMENAPGLITTGYPIVKKMVEQLSPHYKFTILTDEAGRHDVCMKRRRTMIIGWRRDHFGDQVMRVDGSASAPFHVEHAFQGLSVSVAGSNVPNHQTIVKFCGEFYDAVPKALDVVGFGRSTSYNRALHQLWKEDPVSFEASVTPKALRSMRLDFDRIDSDTLLWDKSAFRIPYDGLAPSMTSLTRNIHPTEARGLTIREYARIMGYPDHFVFLDEGIHIVQVMAQQVPVNFVAWLARNVKKQLETPEPVSDAVVYYQHNRSGLGGPVTYDEIMSRTKLGPEQFSAMPTQDSLSGF